MLNINFNLDKKDRPTYIIAVMRYSGNRIRMSMSSLGVPKVNPRNWNPNKQKAKGEGSATINHYLDKFIRVSKEAYHETNLKEGIPQPAKLKSLIKNRYAGIKDEQEQTFNDFFDKYLEEIKESKAKNTFKGYQTARNILWSYQTLSKVEFDFKNMDLQWCIDFERHILSSGRSPNTCHKIIMRIKKVLRDANSRGINKYDHFNNSDFKGKKTAVKEHVVLSVAELERIYWSDMEEGLDNARDLFLIGCHTGLRVSDYSRLLAEENIYNEGGRQYIRIRTKKNGEDVIIPINPTVRAILEKRGGQLPRSISTQKFNTFIKEVSRISGVTEKISRTEYVGNTKIVRTYFKYELVSSHTARRSFATNAVLEGVPYHWIMQITGHKSVSSFEKYVKIGARQAAVLLAKHPFFNKSVLRAV